MNQSEKHKNLLVIVVGLLVLYLIFKNIYIFYAACGIGIISLLVPIVGDWILTAWGMIGKVLGYINTKILLSLVFFIFLTPIALFQKLVSRTNFLGLKNMEGSNYTKRNHKYVAEDFENPW